MIRAIRTWWARRRAVADWMRVHLAHGGKPLPRFDPENGERLWWQFVLAPNQGFDPQTGEAICGWFVVGAHANRRARRGVQSGAGWMPLPLPSFWRITEQGQAPELVKPRAPKRPPSGGSSVTPPQPRQA